jgi:glycosyltransferase involved in cell wall biosynthesis
MRPSKKINVILPFIVNTGGIKQVLEYSRVFQNDGFEVTVFYPWIKYKEYFELKSILRAVFAHYASPAVFLNKLLRRFSGKNNVNIGRDEILRFKRVPLISSPFIPPADVIIATSWTTANSVAKLPPECGDKVYFIQGYEIWGGFKERAERTYSLPMKLVTISPWLTAVIERISKRKITAEIHNGINLQVFKPAIKNRDRLRILMPYHILPQKAAMQGIEVLRSLSKKFPEVEINLFGLFNNPNIGDFYTYHQNPEPGRLVELYQQSHIMLYPSLEEGWGLSILEAMACHCAVVANDMGCVPVLYDGKNMLISKSFDFKELERHIAYLIENPDELERISENGYRTALGFDVGVQARKFMEIFK